MILSASRRTDIPAFYSKWFINRLRAGYVLTRNPVNHSQISEITLSPKIIDCIVFWTKDPQNMIKYLQEIDDRGYRYYFQFTLTPYNKILEKNLRNKEEIINTFINLSKTIGKNKIIWRYDPIILNQDIDINFHINSFSRMCGQLHEYTNTVIISFVDLYAKLKTPFIRQITQNEIAEISKSFYNIAAKYNLTLKACCEKTDLSQYGIKKSSCIDKDIIEKICDCTINVQTDKNQRDGCGCIRSVDIGAYNTCKNGCVYCYANYSENSVINNCRRHNENGELIIGETAATDKIIERKTESLKVFQTEMEEFL